MSLDHYLTTEPDEPEEWAACESCGVHKPWRQMFIRSTGGRFPTEVWACDECCGIEEEDADSPPLTREEACAESIREMLAPCTDLAYRRGCTCFMSPVHPTDTDPPEPVVNRNCPLHGTPMDEV